MVHKKRTQRHFFTIDLEEYFQVLAFAQAVPIEKWSDYPSRAEQQTDRLLELLDRHGTKATFFAVGWLADRKPGLIERVAAQGHELASHTWWHRHLGSLTRDEFREEARRSRTILEGITGQRVYGFRAPSFSINPGREWAFDILLEEGYLYDSSVFPIWRPDYGYPGAPRRPYLIKRQAGTLLELPMATTTFAGITLPAAGGGYLRHFPPALVHRAFSQQERNGDPGMFYIHPWEIDPDQPKIPVSWLTRRRHYAGLAKTLDRLDRLLEEFDFTSVADYYDIGTRVGEDSEWSPAQSA